LEDILLFSARNYLAVDRVPLRDAVRRLCNDGRRIPWDPEKGPGKDWLAGFLRRHPRVAERSTRIYEANRITEEEESRMVQFYERRAALLDEVKPEANHVHNTDETSTTPQGTKTTKAFAESGQKVVGSMRSNLRENTTVVATISADGHTWAPTIIFKGQRLQADWFVERNGPEGAKYTCTDSSFMQGDVFIAYLKFFHKQLGDRGLLDGKPHILLLDGHASHVSVEVIRLAMNLKIILFQLPSHTSHITQPLDVVAFGRFKKSVTRVLASFYHNSGGLLPLKRDMPGVIADAWKVSFTPEINKSSFAGAGLWPVNKDRALGRLKGTAQKKERRDERPPLQDVPIAAPNEQLEKDIGERALRVLRGQGHTVTGIRVGTVLLGGLLTQRKRAKMATSRGSLGLPDGGNITAPEFLDAVAEKERADKAESDAKAARAKVREEKRAEKAAAELLRQA
ncbi:unnamed protein product, partial [Pylaiella littoralis]